MFNFHLAFVVLFILFITIRVYYNVRAGGHRDPSYSPVEGALVYRIRQMALIPFPVLLVLHMVAPQWFAWATWPFPDVVRWFGLGLAVLSLPELIWVHHNLGRNFSGTIRIRGDHQLVTSGPYRWVRHPMYPGLLAFVVGTLLLTGYWLIMLPALIGLLLIIVTRTPREEKQLIEQFGDTYHQYMQRTKRFIPGVW